MGFKRTFKHPLGTHTDYSSIKKFHRRLHDGLDERYGPVNVHLHNTAPQVPVNSPRDPLDRRIATGTFGYPPGSVFRQSAAVERPHNTTTKVTSRTCTKTRQTLLSPDDSVL